MDVRNFWFDADVDGYQNYVSGGPRSKNGGMDLVLYIRDKGRIREAVRIFCRENDGNLSIDVDVDGERLERVETER